MKSREKEWQATRIVVSVVRIRIIEILLHREPNLGDKFVAVFQLSIDFPENGEGIISSFLCTFLLRRNKRGN